MTQKYENNNLALCHSYRHVTKAAAMMVGVLLVSGTLADILLLCL